MSIDIFEFYHGAVLAKLLYKGTELKIKAFPSDGNCTFSINNKIGLYIKYSKKRMTPWVFTFKKKHQEEFQILSELHKKTFLALVCGDDVIACLEYDQFKKIFHTNVDDFEWIKAHRFRRESYEISAKDGKLKGKISQNSFPDIVINSL